jgi:hypothetical protein
MTYNELRNALKTLRSNGSTLTIKLSGKGITKDVLQAEYDRLTTTKAPNTPVAHSFKAMAPQKIQTKARGFIIKSWKERVSEVILLSDWYGDEYYRIA